MSAQADARFMARALQLAHRGLYTTDPNPRVGCVVVSGGEIVGEGWHVRAGEPHAEVNALRAAGDAARGASVYISLEPCSHQGRTPPCVNALIDARVGRVVAAMEDPNPAVNGGGLQRLRDAGIEVETGVLRAQAEALNPGFVSRMRRGRPWLRVKLAASLDGRTALASGESQWITSPAARDDVQRLRARSSAIMTGAGTVLADDPALTVRLQGVERQPLRVVVDSNLSTPETARVVTGPGKVLIATRGDDPGYAQTLERIGAEVLTLPGAGGVDLLALTDRLGQRQVNEVTVEAGATLCGALVEAGLVDELVVYLAPQLLGDAARGMFALPGVQRLAERVELDVIDVRAVGRDWRITARVRHRAGAQA